MRYVQAGGLIFSAFLGVPPPFSTFIPVHFFHYNFSNRLRLRRNPCHRQYRLRSSPTLSMSYPCHPLACPHTLCIQNKRADFGLYFPATSTAPERQGESAQMGPACRRGMVAAVENRGRSILVVLEARQRRPPHQQPRLPVRSRRRWCWDGRGGGICP